jgi:lipopolysaccharide transport system ATP-binding protein
MKPIIKIENLSKQYRLGDIGTGTLSHDLNRWWHTVRGKEDPYLKIGEANDRTSKGNSDYVWAMQDINLEVMPGEVLGIIGKNGAGKSTLLKLLSRVTAPTTGSIKTRGRMASLLEVGTGFHPELTGRENIFLNGAILGMTKKEIKSKFDEIVDFAGCERYIDTPVKRYSSGMYVRLAFAVAAHLEPEILVVDEVLAVGDAEFQKKAIGKMQDVSKNEGRTVLFVSHNMGAVQNLCTRGIVLDKGFISFSGNVSNAIDFYISSGNKSKNSYLAETILENNINKIELLNNRNQITNNFKFDDAITMESAFHLDEYNYKKTEIGLKIVDIKERVIFTVNKPASEFHRTKDGFYNISITIPSSILVPNTYKVIFALHVPNVMFISMLDGEINFTIEETGSNLYQYANVDNGCVFVDCKWENK